MPLRKKKTKQESVKVIMGDNLKPVAICCKLKCRKNKISPVSCFPCNEKKRAQLHTPRKSIPNHAPDPKQPDDDLHRRDDDPRDDPDGAPQSELADAPVRDLDLAADAVGVLVDPVEHLGLRLHLVVDLQPHLLLPPHNRRERVHLLVLLAHHLPLQQHDPVVVQLPDFFLLTFLFIRIPNLPFFYLAYRAWSHWRALEGGKHLRFLLDNKLLALNPSKLLNDIYHPLIPANTSPTPSKPATGDVNPLKGKDEAIKDEEILLSQANGQRIAKALELPELGVEIERAIWQVNHAKKVKQEEAAKHADADAPRDKEKSTRPGEDEKK